MIFQTFLHNKKWQHKDPAVRLEAITELEHPVDVQDPDIEAAGLVINDLATNDTDRAVRLAAIARVRDPLILEPLRAEADEDIAQAVLVQYCRIISGAATSSLSTTERMALMQAMSDQRTLLAVLHDCGCEETGLACLLRLQSEFALDEKALLDIASYSNNHIIRHAAAQAIHDPALLEQLADLSRHKDKAVYKHCKETLQVLQDAQAQRQAEEALALDICDSLESLATKPIGAISQAQLDYKRSQWLDVLHVADPALTNRFEAACSALNERIEEHAAARQQIALQQQSIVDLATSCAEAETALNALSTPLESEQVDHLEQHLHTLQALHAQNTIDTSTDPELTTSCALLIDKANQIVNAFHALETKAPDMESVGTEITTISPKNTAAVRKLQQRWRKLFQHDTWPVTLPQSAMFNQFLALEQQVEKLLSRNKAYLEKLHQDSLTNVAALAQHIEQGQVNEAQRYWDKVQGASKNADTDLQQLLQEMLAPFKAPLKELVDWKNFATSQKKKELIANMAALAADTDLHVPEKAKKIKALQEEWKTLGHSVQNDALWAEFNKLAHLAFEPCKQHFKERKAKMQTNLEARNSICADLEALLPTLTPESLNLSSLNKIERKALEDWKLHAPVEQGKIKKLQKRFNDALSAVRQFKRKTLQANTALKQELIDQAQQLDKLEDVKEAMAEAKKLQAAWKNIGPSPFKDDRDHWNAFRAACDVIFNKRPAPIPRAATTAPSNRHKDKSNHPFESKPAAPAADKKTLQLIGQLTPKAEFCAQLEQEAMAGKPITDKLDEINEQWQALGRISNLSQEQALEQRFHSLSQGVEARILKRQAKDNEEKAREICIAAEIHAGVDSPESDKALRMQVQLKQLKSSFGQRDSKTPAQQLNELEMQLMCLGPLDKAARADFMQRIHQTKTHV